MHDVTVIKIFAFNDTEKCFQSSTEPNSSSKNIFIIKFRL